MKFLDLAPLFGALCNFILAVFVLWQDRRSRLNQVFFLWGICITIWNIGTFALFLRPSPEIAYEWARFLQMGVIFIPCTLLHLSLLIANIERPKTIIGLYILGGLLAFSNLAGFFISGVRYVGYAYYSIAGPGFWIFFCTFSLTGLSIAILLWKRRGLPPLQRKRLNGMICAQTLLVTLGTNDILPILGIDHYPFTNRAIYPYGSLAAVFYGIIVGYSVLQHQILDVQIAVGRLAAHFIRFLFLAVIAVALQLVITLFGPEIGVFSFFTSIGVLLISSLTASILFPRLIGSTAEGLERRLLGDHFEYQDQVRNFLESMTWYGDVAVLLNDIHELFTRTLRLASYQVILRDETNRVFTVIRANPEQVPRQLPELKVESPLFQYFAWDKAEYLSLRSDVLRAGESALAAQAREQLHDFDGGFCLPLVSENEPFGLLVVGEKLNGAPYTATDLTLLVALAKNMSLMINQIRLKTQILQAEELELLGRMSRGVAHDLNNLLTPISTLLQLSSEGVPQEAMEELLPVALRNVKAMRAYIRESLFFSENLRPDFQLGRLDVLVAQAAEVARNSRDKVVDIITETPGEILVEMDEVLIQRMIANLISNAIDASATDAKIRVELVRLIKTEASRDWLRVRIIDKGEGIRKEDLNRVFTPYFTTKNRGDETRGFGLGLAICRKIVNLHGGNLSIASQLKRGTTVQVDLPSRQIKQAASPVAA